MSGHNQGHHTAAPVLSAQASPIPLKPPLRPCEPAFGDGVTPNVIKTAGFLAAAGVLVFALAFQYAVQAIGAIQVLGVVLESVMQPCVFRHSAASFLFFGKRKNAAPSVLMESAAFCSQIRD
jgi:hypothetical protein